MTDPGVRRGGRPEDGQVSLLILVYTLIAAAMVVVAVDASAFFLTQRGLSSVADGAALSAAQAVDEEAMYAGRAHSGLPLESAAVRSAVENYVADRDVGATYPALQVAAAATDGETVTVTLTEEKQLPFLGLVSALSNAFPDGRVRVQVTAHARSPFR